jgi:myo-inositol-1(or 4)-monophosphatase
LSTQEYHADLEIAFAAVRRATPVIMRAFRTKQDVVYKSQDQPQTAADVEADRVLQEVLLGDRPGYGWLSEEIRDTPERLTRSRVWIVDPIDGTRSFIAGRSEFAISIGLAENGAVALGVIANPATDEIFWAVRGAGAFVYPKQRIHVAQNDRVRRIAASRSELKRGEFAELVGTAEVVGVGSTAYKMAKVAAGEVDIFLSRGPKSEWDVCAGDLLVREAGGRVTDLRAETLRYNRTDPYIHGILASSGAQHDAIMGIVRKLPPTGRLRGENT